MIAFDDQHIMRQSRKGCLRKVLGAFTNYFAGHSGSQNTLLSSDTPSSRRNSGVILPSPPVSQASQSQEQMHGIGSQNHVCPSDVPVFLAIDTESLSKSCERRRLDKFQIGVAMFNPLEPVSETKVHNFVCGPKSYCDRVMPDFIFGECTKLPTDRKWERIEHSLASVWPRDRQVMLVAHAPGAEMRLLSRCRIPLPFHGIIDTQHMALQLLKLKEPPALGHTAAALGIPPYYLHSARTDALYTLAIMLELTHRHTSTSRCSTTGLRIAAASRELRSMIEIVGQDAYHKRSEEHKESWIETCERMKTEGLEQGTAVRRDRAARRVEHEAREEENLSSLVSMFDG